jgi:probable DNA repair protein
MKSSAELPRQIQQALERGWTVLTANQRAARTLHHGYDLDQRARGLTHWEPPAILAWDAWLASLWHRLLLDGRASELLLSPTQEHTLWRAIIAADPVNASLRPIDSLAELAAEAWLLLHAYCGRRRLQAAVANADTRDFARWANEFDRRAIRAQLLTQAQLPEALRAAFAEGRFTATQPAQPPQAGLLFVGFDSMKPAQTALLDAIQATGTPIEEHSPKIPCTSSGAPSIAVSPRWMGSPDREPGAPSIAVSSRWVGSPDREPDAIPSLTLVSAPDERAELAACARWLRARLTQQPDARIAVIVPAIETVRAQIDRVFRQTLAPELNQIDAPANSGPYEFSLGVPLAHTPMVAAALDILRWATGPLALDRVSALLLSPHFAAGNPESGPESTSPVSSELLARAEFDAFVLRKHPLLQPQITLDELHALVAESRHISSLTNLLHRLSALRPLFLRRDLLTAQQTHAEWAATFHELLDAAGWAAPGRDDSTEFQTRRKWQSALDELATLDFDSRSDGTRVPFAAALAALERIATETLFAPESRHAPIQIMGPLESAGSRFDAVWFLGSSDLAWPARPAPNPLLPWLLQRELAMPGADPAQDTAHARRITQRIAASAPDVLFSYAQQSSEGHQRPSPVLAGLALELRTSGEIAATEPAAEPVELEAFADDAPIPPPPDRVLHGGASILASQAACGFRAFAEKRLFSSALDTASLGLDPRQRGSLVHAVLESFWAEVESQSALQLLTPEEREARLMHCIRVTLDRQYPNPASGWPRAYLLTERQRLLKLLGPWLDFEANQRAPFTVKSREETLHDVQIGPLRLNIRVDRVDRIDLTQLPSESVEDEPADSEPKGENLAGEIILDYKTGPASPADWLGDRPDAPQLPLYAVVSAAANKEDAPQFAAVAFASVRPGKDLGLHGYQSRDGVLPSAAKLKTTSLEAQVDEWREVLTALAEDFHSGEARVDPKQYPQTCAHCEQRLLCRLDPATLDANSLDEDSGAEAPAGFSDSASAEAARG